MATKLTQQGYEKLHNELRELKTVKRREVIRALAEARAHGDLRENAEYEAAKEAQAHLEHRIAQLETNLSDVVIIDRAGIDPTKVYLGAPVTLTDLTNKRELQYTMVSKEEADFSNGKISIESPVGRALLGKGVGDTVDITVPAGQLKYKIEQITR